MLNSTLRMGPWLVLACLNVGCCCFQPCGMGMGGCDTYGIAGSSIAMDEGCCGTCDSAVPCDSCAAPACEYGLFQVFHPLTALRQRCQHLLSCGSGCGPVYYDEWHSDPPDCVDPCPAECSSCKPNSFVRPWGLRYRCDDCTSHAYGWSGGMATEGEIIGEGEVVQTPTELGESIVEETAMAPRFRPFPTRSRRVYRASRPTFGKQ